jgi:hypothetical protein
MGLKDEAQLLAEEYTPDITYTRRQNAKSLQDFKLTTKPTDFDSTLFRDVKLRQLPSFIYQNMGWTGLYRFDNFVSRKMGSFFHTSNARGIRWFYLALFLISVPNVINAYIKEKRRADLIIKLKYGDEYEKMDSFEKTYIFQQVVRKMNEPHFA